MFIRNKQWKWEEPDWQLRVVLWFPSPLSSHENVWLSRLSHVFLTMEIEQSCSQTWTSSLLNCLFFFVLGSVGTCTTQSKLASKLFSGNTVVIVLISMVKGVLFWLCSSWFQWNNRAYIMTLSLLYRVRAVSPLAIMAKKKSWFCMQWFLAYYF